MIQEILDEREKTHGNFDDVSEVYKFLMTSIKDKPDISAHAMLALSMIFQKCARILSGDQHFADHWADIAGYAELCRQRCR